jgi:N-acetylmuramoyl-L-alanine amidase
MVLHAYMTRVLIETGFISNVEEGNRLDSEEGQNEIGDCNYKSIKKMSITVMVQQLTC